jgi:hypothetical protein
MSCHGTKGGLILSKHINNIKLEYNNLLEREKKAEEFLNKANEKQREKWTPEFIKITKDLSSLIYKFKSAIGREMTQDEILNGFRNINHQL